MHLQYFKPIIILEYIKDISDLRQVSYTFWDETTIIILVLLDWLNRNEFLCCQVNGTVVLKDLGFDFRIEL